MRPGRGEGRPEPNGLRARRVARPVPQGELTTWERKREEAQRLDAAAVARQNRERLAQLVFRGLATCDRMMVVVVENRRSWIGGADDRSAAKILAEHPQGLVGIYTRACAWGDLLADLEAAGL